MTINVSGSGTPTTLDELMQIINNFCVTKAIPTNQPTYLTQNAVTLYTPNANCTHYVIRQRNDNTGYNVIWTKIPNFDYAYMYYDASAIFSICKYLYLKTTNNLPVVLGDINTIQTSCPPPNTVVSDVKLRFNAQIATTTTSYISDLFATEEEAIAAIQSPTTNYTTNTLPNFNKSLSYTLISNMLNIRYNSANQEYSVEYVRTISPNETIEVIV